MALLKDAVLLLKAAGHKVSQHAYCFTWLKGVIGDMLCLNLYSYEETGKKMRLETELLALSKDLKDAMLLVPEGNSC